MLLKLSIFLFAVVGLSLFLTGCLYLSLDEFMPYHAEALEQDWNSLSTNYQGLLLGLIKGLGGGAFVSGLAVLIMVVASLRKSPTPFLLLLPVTAIGYSALLCYATLTVYLGTPGNPPLLLTIVLAATSILASLALAISHRGNSGI